MASAAEAELGAVFYNAKDAAMLQTILEELGHPQAATPIQTDNVCASGIANNTVKQRRSKAMDMRFYWVKIVSRKESLWFTGEKEVKMMPIISQSIILRAIIASCVPDSCSLSRPSRLLSVARVC
jgi:hypothetical protein